VLAAIQGQPFVLVVVRIALQGDFGRILKILPLEGFLYFTG